MPMGVKRGADMPFDEFMRMSLQSAFPTPRRLPVSVHLSVRLNAKYRSDLMIALTIW